VFERDEVSSVVGSLLLDEASETATAGAKRYGADQRIAKPMKAESCTPEAIIARVGRCPLHVPRRDLITARRHDFPL
jgi:hypothetical protein